MRFDRRDVQRILGWHDGARSAVISDALGREMVQIHEAMHGRLFHETLDGHLHRFCALAAGTPYDVEHQRTYSFLAERLLRDTLYAHEAAATYLGLQSLTLDQRSVEIEVLPEDYREYYDALAKLIDPLSPSSWMRAAFGWTLSHWCFNSPRFVAFFSNERPDRDAVMAIASPSDRLRQAGRLLSDAMLKAWRETAVSGAIPLSREEGVELWDLDDEVQWEARRGSRSVSVIENYINHKAGIWLLENLAIETQDFRAPFPDDLPGLQALGEALNLNIRLGQRGRDTDIDPRHRVERLERLAREHGSDTIEHFVTCPISAVTEPDSFRQTAAEKARTSTDIFFLSSLESANELLILFRSETGSPREGKRAYTFADNGSYRAPREVAIRLAQVLLQDEMREMMPSLRLWVMVAASGSTIFEAGETAMCLACNLQTEAPPSATRPADIPAERVLIYWHDNWVRLHALPEVEVSSEKIAFVDGPDGTPKPLDIRILRSSAAFPGYFVSAKTALAGGRIGDYEDAAIEEGKLGRLAPDLERTWDLVAPITVAWHVWPRF